MIDFLSAIVSKWGMVPFILILLIYVVGGYISYKIVGESRKKKNNINAITHTMNDKLELKYHPFFSNCQYKLAVEIPSLVLSSDKPVKQQLFRDLLSILMKNLESGFIDITKMNIDVWTPEQWSSELTNKFSEMLYKFHKDSLMEGIPKIVLTKFGKWNQVSLESFYEYITGFGNSGTFDSNHARTNSLLWVLNVLLITTIADAEKTLKDLNGEISGKSYKGGVIEH